MNRSIYSLSAILLTAGCVAQLQADDWVGNNPSHVQTAFEYIWKNEQNNQQELEVLLGIDPVRTEWCAAFVNAVLLKNDIPGSESIHEFPLLAKSFLEWGHAVHPDDVRSGDIVVFPRGNKGWQGHVGFYIGQTVHDDVLFYLILGGNQDQMVSVEKYTAKRALAIRRPID